MVLGLAIAIAAGAPARALAHSVTLNLKDADLSTLIATVSEATGKNFVVDPRVKGTVTVVSAKPLSEQELYQAFLSVLQVHGFAAVPSGKVIKIVPVANARVEGAFAAPGAGAATGDELVTQVVAVHYVRAAQLVPILRPLVPQQGHLAADAASNTLIISDRAANVARLVKIIARVDVPGDAGIEVFPLEHASATEVARILNELNARTATPGAKPQARRLVADARTNSILIGGDPTFRLRMRAIISHLDTPIANEGNTDVIYLHYANAKDLAPILEGISSTLESDRGAAAPAAAGGKAHAKTNIQVDEQNNAIVITASPAVQRALSTVVQQLDVRRAQVLVEAVIAEIATDKLGEFGIQWRATTNPTGNGAFGGTNFGTGQSSLSQLTANPLSLGSGLSLGLISGTATFAGQPFANIAALIRALASDSSTNILSTPSLVTLDNQSAEIVVAQNVPFVTGQYVNTGASSAAVSPFQTIRRKDVGLILRVKPQINEGNALKLNIQQEVSNVVPNGTSSSASAQGAVDLITNRRVLKTTVMVNDGQILVLGGLMSNDFEQSQEKVPLLGDIPVLGSLFRFQHTTKTKRDLMIFLRPVILRPGRGDLLTSEKYDYMRAQQMDRGQKPNVLREEGPVMPRIEHYRNAPEMKLPAKPARGGSADPPGGAPRAQP